MAVRSRGLVSVGQRLIITSRGGGLFSAGGGVSASKLNCPRYCSGPSWEDAADGEMDMSPSRRLEQALHEIRIQKAAPDWLPLFPGGSFWIHPDQIAKGEPAKPSGPLLEPASEREVFAMVAPMGWPTSSAVDDGRTPVIEVEVMDASASSYGPTSEEELLAFLVPSGWPELSSTAEAMCSESEAGH